MQVTQLIQDIGKCRDVLETKDFKNIETHVYHRGYCPECASKIENSLTEEITE